ncbi:MAG TPA: hypothetical protein VHG92_05495 [Afifellaceae bacterium]|nr:hypothetical protein [Afifellaceae bacterium]
MNAAKLALAVAVAAGLAGIASAQEMKASQRSSGGVVGFDLQGPYKNVTLSIAGPKGFSATTSVERGNPSLNLGRGLPDGVYTYQLSAATDEPADVVPQGLDNGRGEGAKDRKPLRDVSTSGSFVVRNGSILPPQALAEEKEQ